MSIFNKMLVSSTLALSVWVSTPAAHSGTIDFVALAANNEGPYAGGTYSGITLTASALGGAYTPPYLDDLSRGRPAGLGFCSIKNGACAGKADDNIGNVQNKYGAAMETLRLSFDPL